MLFSILDPGGTHLVQNFSLLITLWRPKRTIPAVRHGCVCKPLKVLSILRSGHTDLAYHKKPLGKELPAGHSISLYHFLTSSTRIFEPFS